jgi:predicted GNAT family acetyltransferase
MTQPADDAEISVRDAPDQNRFEIWVDGVLAGFTVYRAQPDRYTFIHTEIDPAFGGRGLASVLIKAALDAMRERGIAVLPQCPFVRRYISRHSEYLDLVPAAERARFDLPADAAAPNS